MIFVPSLAGSWEQFADAARAIRANHRTVIVELRGQAQSTPPKDSDYSIDGYAADLTAVVEDRRIGDSVLVGYSLGGGVALAYAAANSNWLVDRNVHL